MSPVDESETEFYSVSPSADPSDRPNLENPGDWLADRSRVRNMLGIERVKSDSSSDSDDSIEIVASASTVDMGSSENHRDPAQGHPVARTRAMASAGLGEGSEVRPGKDERRRERSRSMSNPPVEPSGGAVLSH